MSGGADNDRLILTASAEGRAQGVAAGGAGHDIITLQGATGGTARGGDGYDILVIEAERAEGGIGFGFQRFSGGSVLPGDAIKGTSGFELLLGETGQGDDEIWLNAPVALDLARPVLRDRGFGDLDLLRIDFSQGAIDQSAPAQGVKGVTIDGREILPRYAAGEISNPVKYFGYERTWLIGSPGNDVLTPTGHRTAEDVEHAGIASGGPGDDVLLGTNAVRDELDGGPGLDVIAGGGFGTSAVTGALLGQNIYHYRSGNEIDILVTALRTGQGGDQIYLDAGLWGSFTSLDTLLDDHLVIYRGTDVQNRPDLTDPIFGGLDPRGSAALDFGGGDVLVLNGWSLDDVRAQAEDLFVRDGLF